MADCASTSAAARVIDASLEDAKAELKKSVQRLLIQNLRKRNDAVGDKRLIRVNSVGAVSTQNNGPRRELLGSDSQVAKYLRERGYEYTLSVLMAEANVPDSNVLVRGISGEAQCILPRFRGADHIRSLKSIATRLNDSRSRLVIGNPEFQTAVLQIWDETEKRYNEKLRQYVIDWEMKQTMQLKQVERILRRRIVDEEEEMKRQLSNRLMEVEEKEKELQNSFHEKIAAFEHQVDQDKRQLLASARELEGKRQDLQVLETEFNRQVDTEQNRIRVVKESLNQLSAELKRQQLQLTFQMDEAVKEARRQEETRYAEKLQQISRKEEKIRGIIEKAKLSRGQVDALKYMLGERDSKIQELELIAQQFKTELIKYQDRLREKEEQLRRMSDYELVKSENSRMKDESRFIRDQLSKEKVQLQRRNLELEAQCRNMAAQIDEWKPADENPFKKELIRQRMEFEKAKVDWKTNETHYRKQLEGEKSKNDCLRLNLDDQSGKLQVLVEKVKKLEFQLAKRRAMGDVDVFDEGRRKGRVEIAGGTVNDLEDEEEPTPDYLKEAKRRLKMLERETETFEESVRRYQQKAIDASSLAAWQAQTASSAYTASTFRNEDAHADFDHVSTISKNQDGPEVYRRNDKPSTSWQTQLREGPSSTEPPKQMEKSDDWETKLRKREEERRRRDEEFRKQQEEEMKRTHEQPAVSTSVKVPLSAPTEQSTESQSTTPAVDPVLQKYMQMVLEQRQKEKESMEGANGIIDKPNADQASKGAMDSVKENEVEVASIKEPSSESDFDW